MARQQAAEATGPHSAPRSTPDPERKPEYPVREYIAAMTQELAQMARWDGDDVLAGMLEAASFRAEGERP